MSINLDRAVIGGRVTHKPVMRETTKGDPATTIPVAVNKRFRDSAGEWAKQTVFLDIQAYAGAARVAVDRLEVGQTVLIEARHQTRKVKDVETKRDVTIMELVAEHIHFDNSEHFTPTPQ